MTTRNVIIVLLAFAMTACGDTQRTITKTVYECGPSDKVANFILQCIENGNPKSDEEPEDWIWLCEQMANRALCPGVTYEVHQELYGGQWTELSRQRVTKQDNEQ